MMNERELTDLWTSYTKLIDKIDRDPMSTLAKSSNPNRLPLINKSRLGINQITNTVLSAIIPQFGI